MNKLIIPALLAIIASALLGIHPLPVVKADCPYSQQTGGARVPGVTGGGTVQITCIPPPGGPPHSGCGFTIPTSNCGYTLKGPGESIACPPPIFGNTRTAVVDGQTVTQPNSC